MFMDWIETLFGFAPDNGDGTFELMITALALTVVAVAVVWKVPRARAVALRFFAQMQARFAGRPIR
jgi:hypothetical protein